MNHQHDRTSNDPDAIRSEIDHTRERMDSTINALADRMKGRHIVDEVLGYFRSPRGSARANRLKHRVGDSAGSAMHSMVDTVKGNPGPSIVIGAGIAWMIYNAVNRSSSDFEYDEYGDEEFGDPGFYEGGGASYHPSHISGAGEVNPYDYDESDGESRTERLKHKIGESAEEAKHRMSEAKHRMGEAMSHLGDRARRRSEAARRRAGEMGSRVQSRTHDIYEQSRERMAQSVEEHPLAIGLGCLALGVIAGLALPTPAKVEEYAGPRADRLRRRARDLGEEYVEKGKHVAHAAADAVKEEAANQGLTPDALRQKAEAVADRAKNTAKETAREEGIPGAGDKKNRPSGGSSGTSGSTASTASTASTGSKGSAGFTGSSGSAGSSQSKTT